MSPVTANSTNDTLLSEEYNGGTPTGPYIANFYKQQSKAIKSQLQKEVKKRGAKVLSVDVSYKADQKTCNIDGQPIFKGLFTGTNELGEIRLLARLCSDSHEQLKTPLEAFKHTQQEYGLDPVEYVFTDDPA